MTIKKIQVTESGLKKLQEEYNHLVHVVRDEVKEDLKAARAQGDLSENADYDAAREKQAQVEAKIRELEVMLSNYEIIETSTKKSKNDVVKIGTTVTLKFLDTGATETYEIIGTTEADPLNYKISNETPLAEAIMDQKAGAVVTVTNIKNPYDVEILKIK